MFNSTISSGITSSGFTLSNGDNLYVYGTVSGTVVSRGGNEFVYVGGTASDTTVSSGGYQEVSAGGSAISTTVDNGGYDGVFGGTVSFTTVSSGGLEDVNSGGTAVSTTVSHGGVQDLGFASGRSISTLLTGGGIEIINNPVNSSSDTVVSSGSAEFVYSGGTASFTTLSSGGFLVVLPGGTQSDTRLSGGEIVSTGVVVYQPSSGVTVYDDVASNIVVGTRGTEYILPQGSAVSTTVTGDGFDTVYSGGTASFATLNSGIESVSSGGETISTTVHNGGIEEVTPGGTASFTTISSGGLGDDGGTAISATVSNSGLWLVGNGTDSFTTVSSGGSAVAAGGGTASDTTVDHGGYLVVSEGTAIGATVNSGGNERVYAGGKASFTTLSSSVESVYLGGTTVSTTVSNAGNEYVSSGGTTSFTTVSSGGRQYVLSDGTAVSTTVISTTMFVSSGGTASFATAVGAGAFVDVFVGGTAISTTVNSRTSEDVIGAASFTTVSGGPGLGFYGGGAVAVYGGGHTLSTTVSVGGVEQVLAGGVTSDTVLSGGTELLYSGGATVSATVSSGGTQYVYLGTASATTVDSGGYEYVLESAVSTMVSNGGTEVVSSGGTASFTTVDSGGSAVVVAGGSVIDTTVSGFGSASVSSGGSANGTTVAFDGYESVSSGGSAISTTVSRGGTLSAADGGTTSFTVLAGGTEDVDAGASAVSTTVYSVGAQNVSGTAVDATVSSGGNQFVYSSGPGLGTAIGTTVDDGGIQYVTGESAYSIGGTNYPGGGASASDTTLNSGGTEVVNVDAQVTSTTVNSGGIEVVYYGNADAELTRLNIGGSIDVADMVYTGGGSATVNSNNDLIVSVGGQTYTQQLSGDYAGVSFNIGEGNVSGFYLGVLVTDEGTPCYCRGTLILTDRGEIAVEDLHIGDRLVTLSGAARPLRWIGRRSYAGRFAATNPNSLPVLIRRDALADGAPRRDLYVSPLHAMYLDEVLIPAVALVNGASIQQVASVEQVEYFHLELETHDIILAEGAASETFVDDDSRGMFHNAAEYRQLYPHAPRVPAHYCAPRVEDGELLEAVRRRLAARAHPQRLATGAPVGKLLGCLEHVGLDRVAGWARDMASPNSPVWLRILDNDAAIGMVVADQHRDTQRRTGLGDGRCGFEIIIPGGLSPLTHHVIRVERASDGAELPTSPWVVEAAPIAATGPSAPIGALRGQLDQATRERIAGWAQDAAAPETPVALQLLDNGAPIMRVLANLVRTDLAAAGIGSGRYGFDIIMPGGLSPLVRHVLHVRREADGAELPGSPAVIEAAGGFDAGLERALASAVAAIGSDDDRDRALAFILEQADRLLQQRADAESQRTARLNHRRLAGSRGKSAQDAPVGKRPAAEGALAEGVGLRALVIDERLPRSGRDAGSQALLSHMRGLQRLGYAVSFVAAEEIAGDEAGRAALTASGVACCVAPFYASVEDVLRRQAACFDLVYLHRAGIASRYLALARRYMPRARILFSVADLHHVRLERQAAAEERPELLAASRRVRLEECMAAWLADGVITHSADEAELLRRAVPEARVYRVPWQVPGADGRQEVGAEDCAGNGALSGAIVARAAARAVAKRIAPVPFAARRGLLFVGGYAHAPNVDAARWLVEAVMPLVWLADPDIVCLLVGSAMPDTVRRLARPGVVALGEVADLGSVFNRVRLSVAPLRYGAGVKGKVLDSLAAGVPCVMTPVAAEGLELPAGLRALVGEDAAQLARLVRRLHRSEAAHRKAVSAGRSLIRKNHGEAAVIAALRAAVEGRDLAGRRQGTGARVARAA